MEFNEYQSQARRTQNKNLNGHERRLHALFGLCSEVGEIQSIYQKAYQGHCVEKDKVVDELGDLMWFAAELADVLGVNLGDVVQRNIDKLWRRYPEGFDSVRSVNRND